MSSPLALAGRHDGGNLRSRFSAKDVVKPEKAGMVCCTTAVFGCILWMLDNQRKIEAGFKEGDEDVRRYSGSLTEERLAEIEVGGTLSPGMTFDQITGAILSVRSLPLNAPSWASSMEYRTVRT